MRCLSLLRRRLPQTHHQSLQPFLARFLDPPHLDTDSTFCTFDQVTLGTLSTHLLNRAVIVEVATLLAFPCTSQRPIRANLQGSSVQKLKIENFERNQIFEIQLSHCPTWPNGQLESLLQPGLQTFSSQYSPARQCAS